MKLFLRIACPLGVVAALAIIAAVWRMRPKNTEQPAIPSDVASILKNPDAASIQRPSRVLSPSIETPTQKLPPDGLERLRLVLNRDGTAGFAKRVSALRAIKTALTDQELDALFRYLRMPAEDLLPNGENWLRNVILDKLVQQPVMPRGLPDLLVAIYQSRMQNEVMRDYAVQHMAPVYDRGSAQERLALQGALWEATGETGSSIAGTALLAFLDVSQADPSVDRKTISQAALNLANDSHCGELARITAVQVCARMGVQEALPVVQELTLNGQSMVLRIAATAALGDLGNVAVTNQLAQLVKSSNPRQSLAAQSALSRIARVNAQLAKQSGY